MALVYVLVRGDGFSKDSGAWFLLSYYSLACSDLLLGSRALGNNRTCIAATGVAVRLTFFGIIELSTHVGVVY